MGRQAHHTPSTSTEDMLMLAAVLLMATFSCLVLYLQRGWAPTIFTITLLSLTLASFTVLRLSDQHLAHVGVTSSSPALTTFALVLAGASFAVLQGGRLKDGALLAVPSMLLAPLGTLLIWPHSPAVVNGCIYLVTIAWAWIVGWDLGKHLKNERFARHTSFWLLVVTIVAGGSIAIQLLSGDDIRPGGLLGHPSVYGKLVCVLLALLLPLAMSPDVRTRNCSRISIGVGFAITAPTLSRANIVGIFLVALVWLIFMKGARSVYGRVGVLLLLALAVLPFMNQLLSRFENDSEGGARPELLAAGLAQIARNPWLGTGPNGFVEAVAPHDLVVAATGYPVHNSFLLPIAELGVVGALLFFLPLLGVITVGLRNYSQAGQPNWYARSTLAALIGIVFIGMSGWGFVQQPMVHLLYFIVAMSASAAKSKETVVGHDLSVPVLVAGKDVSHPSRRKDVVVHDLNRSPQ